MYHNLLLHSINEHFIGFQFLENMNKAAMNICIYISIFVASECVVINPQFSDGNFSQQCFCDAFCLA